MGCTGSRPSPTTYEAQICDYSKLVRKRNPQTSHIIVLGDLRWNVDVEPMNFNGEGLADSIAVQLSIYDYLRGAPIGIDVSIEILDVTGEHTVFRNDRFQVSYSHGFCRLVVSRKSLEVSSCIRDDGFTVRFTIYDRLRCIFRKSNQPEPPVAMAGSHTLTVASLSELTAALQSDCIHSTHFAVGGSRWFLQFYPDVAVMCLARAQRHDHRPTTAEFSFQLEGALNLESQKMTHTFDNPHHTYIFRYGAEQVSTSDMDDRLLVRCCVTVVMPEKPTLAPAKVPTATTPSTTESILTPLLRK